MCCFSLTENGFQKESGKLGHNFSLSHALYMEMFLTVVNLLFRSHWTVRMSTEAGSTPVGLADLVEKIETQKIK